jgi:glutaminyl-peptide cyclotransferase
METRQSVGLGGSASLRRYTCRVNLKLRLGLVLWAAGVLAGCGPGKTPELQWDAFAGARAYAHVERVVNFGPRPSGSDALKMAGNYIIEQLLEAGLKVEEQAFTANTPRGRVQFRNLVGKTRAQSGKPGSVIIVGSHYDTKHFDEFRFVGANDGGSSVGVLLEMARVATQQPDLWFVFFDGEECMVDYGPEDGLWGSKFFVENLQTSGQVALVDALILLDMVGDKNLNVTIPANSYGPLVQQLFGAARALGYRDYFSLRGSEIYDDHVPFLDAGIRAINIIDFDFGSAPGRNDYWHTSHDTLDKVSAGSLEIVGRTTLQMLSAHRKQPAAR